MKVGYARVSKGIQNKDLQMDALAKEGCERISPAEISGAKFVRPGRDELLDFMRPGDVLVVWRIDRLGRKLPDVLRLVVDLQNRQIDLVSTTQQIDTTTPIGKFFFNITVVFAEFERDQLIERTNAGLQAARARGRVGGRKKNLTDAEEKRVVKLYESREYPIKEICTMINGKSLSPATVHRIVAHHRQQQQAG